MNTFDVSLRGVSALSKLTVVRLAVPLAFAMGVVYAWRMPAGLPYDEPSHWGTVLFYAHHARLPVLGRSGVSYEAQMGPLSYAVDAVVERAARALGASPTTAFHVVRMLGALWFAGCVAIVGSLLARLTSVRMEVVGGLSVFALTPMFLAMSGSVQNDALALFLGLAALELSLRWLDDGPRPLAALVVGAVAGLAVLTKVSAWAAVAAIFVWLLWRHRRAGLFAAAAFGAAALAVSGWWVVRNIHLYGDPTAASAVRRTGVSFSAYHVHGIGGVGHLIEELVTYLWLPTEYVRNTISAPVELKGALLIATVLVVGLAAPRLRRAPSSARLLVLVCAALSLASWLVTDVGFQAVAPRVAYLALPIWVWMVASALSRVRRPRVVVATAILGMILLNAWVLSQLTSVHIGPFISV